MNKKFKIMSVIVAVLMLLSLFLIGCESQPTTVPGAPAEFTRLKIANNWFESYDSNNAYIRITLPSAAGTLATVAGTETLTNKTLTSPTLTTPSMSSPTITGTSVVSNRASGNATLAASGTSVVVTHGLAGTPTRVLLGINGALGTASSATGMNQIYWSGANSTSFVINALVATNATAGINWLAMLADE